VSGWVYAYSDESGNTGNNIFDETQPIFWTGTLITPVELDFFGSKEIEQCCACLGVDELHGNALGLGRIEKIAAEIHRFVYKNDCRFVFTCVEKRHVAATKFVDTVLDSGINKAVSPLHYGNRLLRLCLAHVIVENFSENSQREFWEAFETGNAEIFRRVVSRVKWDIETRLEDPRTKQIFLDALDWALKYPGPLLEATRSELDAPNCVAFSLLVSGVQKVLKGTELRVYKFIHDEQNQFANAFRAMYEMLRQFSFSEAPLSFMTDLEEDYTYECPLEITSSHSLPGLQAIDVILWLIKRQAENPDADFPPNCSALVESTVQRGSISRFSRVQLRESVLIGLAYLFSRPLAPEDLVTGQGIVQRIEEDRQRRMKELPPAPRGG